MQVAIHAGAAFTDEGRLLNSLQKNLNALSNSDVAILGPRRYRQVFKPAFDGLDNPFIDAVSQKRLQGILPAGPTIQRTICSSGQFAGEIASALQDGQLYPQAGRRMALLEQVFEGHEIHFFMGLKNLGSFLSKLLMSLPEQARNGITRNTDLSCLNWIGMIEDIRDLAPNVQITLWSSEDAPFIWGDVVRAIGGLAEDQPLVDEYDLFLSLLDEIGQDNAQARLMQVDVQDKADLRDSLAQIFELHAQPEKIEEELDLPGWSAEIVDAFSELYEQDLARLATMPGVRMLKP